MTRDDPVTLRQFRLWVDGRLSERFSDGLVGVHQREDTDGTMLAGDYVDEAHLHGVLEELRGLGVAVRRFEVVGPPKEERS